MMYECLPARWRAWAEARAAEMGLPDPDAYLVYLVQFDRQAQDLNRAQLWSRPAPPRAIDFSSPATAD